MLAFRVPSFEVRDSATNRLHPRAIGLRVPGSPRLARVDPSPRTLLQSPWNQHADVRFESYSHRASKDEPEYIIKGDKTDQVAIHKGRALKRDLGGDGRESRCTVRVSCEVLARKLTRLGWSTLGVTL